MENRKLRLRALEPEDAEMMYEAESDPAAWRYSDYLAPMSREMLREYALTYDADPLRSGQLRLIIGQSSYPGSSLPSAPPSNQLSLRLRASRYH